MPTLDPNFTKLLNAHQTALRSVRIPGSVALDTSGVGNPTDLNFAWFDGADANDKYHIEFATLEDSPGGGSSPEAGGFAKNATDVVEIAWSTKQLEEQMQQLIADSARESAPGVRRGELDAICQQTQFLLDYQRRAARYSLSRLEKVTRAALRRAYIAGPHGPLERLRSSVEDHFASVGTR